MIKDTLNKLKKITSAVIMITVSFPVSVYAGETTVKDLFGEEVILDDIGDEINVITSTVKSEENSCQVNLKGDIESDFALDVFVDFENEDTGSVYRLYGLCKNDYSSFLFVPEGSYRIIECSVYGDTVNEYPLMIPDDFILSDGEIYTIKTSLIHKEEIKQEIEERKAAETAKEPETPEASENTDIFTQTPTVSVKNPYPWRTVKKSDGFEPEITVSGLSKGKYDFIIKIVKDGQINEAEFIYSTDGGKTYSNNQLLKRTFTPEGTGLTFTFAHNDESGLSKTWKAVYHTGDRATFSCYPEYSISSSVSKGAVINAYQSDTAYTDADIVIKIVNTGKLDTAKFDYSIDGGRTYKGYELPVNKDYELGELPVVVQFSDIAGDYVVNDTFSFSVKGKEIKKDTTYLLYALVGMAFIAAIVFYAHLLSLKEKDSIYRLNEYVPYEVRHPARKH